MTSHAKILPVEDGPLIVTDLPALHDGDGTTIEAGEKTALCRCGLSAKKPFCDGSHKAAGFSSAPETASIRNTPITYSGDVEGTQVTVHYTPVLCSHAAECVKASSAIFDPTRKPWVMPEQGSMADLLAAMSHCPSGALRLEVGTSEPQHMVNGDVDVTVERNGPYRVKNVALDAEFNGAGASQSKYVLCRCGHSKNKPFCDGSHRDAGWTDGSEA
ncbi:MAG: CDGSH iron-sulfur domain-containing protein [Hyphomonas sp.]|nr:CDGSH iron-sulfur domain-containing protein [Hyphomonas sp.]